MHRFSEAIIDLFHWEVIFRKYKLYSREMWEGDGWSGSGIYEGTKKNRVFLAWMHQIDILLIYGSEQLGIKGYLDKKEDLGFAIMPLGVSFELTEDGVGKRSGTRQAHTSGWLWGIPKNAPELADYQKFLNNYYDAFEEIIIKRRYRLEGPNARIDRAFLSEYLK